MPSRIIHSINEYLRINAIRRMLRIVDVTRIEVTGLVIFAVLFAIFEGIGISLLLPILQFAESGGASAFQGSGFIWEALDRFMVVLGLPVTLPVLLALAFLPILMRQVVFYFKTWYSAVVSSRIGIRMRMQTLDTVLDADPEFFGRHSVGKLVNVLITQTNAAGTAILNVIGLLSVGLLMALYMAILLAISAPLTLVTLVFALVVSRLIKTIIRHIREFAVESAAISQEMMGKIVERMGLMPLIKLRDMKRHESENIREYSEEMRQLGIKKSRLGARIEVTTDPLLMLSVFITLYIGISVLGMTLAELGLVVFVLSRLNAKIKEFNNGRQEISKNIAGLLLVQQTAEEAERSNRIMSGPVPFEGLRQELALADVSFDYPDSYNAEGKMLSAGKQVLRGISLEIPAGSFTALVGRSGAGKSTLVELLPRLRDATSGTITYDGTDIRDFNVGSLRKGIGYLTQQAMLFNDTVRANLVYGLDTEPTEEQVRDALERAYATFVYDLPNGLDTHLGDQGVRFSGGERQRIGLARVLLADSSVLILDEPTSALDSESEAYIQKALSELHGTKTVIVIAHRLATVIKADQLLLIDDGRIVERGTHEELVAMGETYQKLFETQLLA
ncbi:ABC transporter ATP-binding protein [Anaerosoma tenue]|uniref:ABC transporter ATP-binding protein n=1 Tax=Anaerosoma tenue TaxID=2933588 RepID=UPI002260AE6C|nr:ABC transporter ATP-binding protein [Anaerosoma tenue]MCK8114686.1 ABC transporter ATP-binding protein/permease [Anaerosoma tenue]